MTLPRRRARPATSYHTVASRSAAVVIDSYSTSFGWASRLLHQPERDHVRNIYALVRVADEIVDDPRVNLPAAHRADMLDALHTETVRAICTGWSANLVVHAFARTARRFAIGADLITPFFDSMRTDLDVHTHDRQSLDTYVHGSAEVVGLMCLRVFCAGDQRLYALLAPGAIRLGAAFQKVNFLRDLGQDHDGLGRTYFPGLDPEAFTDAHRDELLDEIDADLRAAEAVLNRLPPSSRRAVRAAHSLFGELANGLRTTPAAQIRTARVRVPNTTKGWLVARAVATGGRR